MDNKIKERIIELGGICNFDNKSMQANIESISFNKTYLIKGFEDFLTKDTCQKIKEGKTLSDEEIPYPRMIFQPKLFTPFKEGSADYDEFHDLDQDVIRSVINGETLEFLMIGETDSFPNFYFVYLSDKNTENPTVYSTDHEVFFDEISIEGTLEEFFHQFVSESEYQLTMEKLTDELRSK